jgi:hypothetical protein
VSKRSLLAGARSRYAPKWLGRMTHRYEQFTFEQWDEATGQRSYPTVNLRAMITEYDNEAARVLSDVLFELKRKCP